MAAAEGAVVVGHGRLLLDQLELILEHGRLIDEVGIVHPSLFDSLEANQGLKSSSIQYDKSVFWYHDNKLAISTEALCSLYNAALDAYMDARRRHTVMPDAIEHQCIMDDILKHSRALLVVCCDFNPAWNSRKIVLSRKCQPSLFMDELNFSTLILSYSPKSEHAWSHRRWVIKTISRIVQNIHAIIEKESKLVKKIAEKAKMNYRAWNHRCWLIYYMTNVQVIDELDKAKIWVELHVADSSCFHYCRQLMVRLLDLSIMKHDGRTSVGHKLDTYPIWKEELKWNELLIKRYIGREALWNHRRFLAQYWIKYFLSDQQLLSASVEDPCDISLDVFLDIELELLDVSLGISGDDFEDSRHQACLATSYMLWISKQNLVSQHRKFQQKLDEYGGIKAILIRTCPEKSSLWRDMLN